MQYARLLKASFNTAIKVLQSDNDTVFLSENFNKFLAEEGTKRLLARALSWFHTSGLPIVTWGNSACSHS